MGEVWKALKSHGTGTLVCVSVCWVVHARTCCTDPYVFVDVFMEIFSASGEALCPLLIKKNPIYGNVNRARCDSS